MFRKKCASCNKKASKKFNYCPYCGHSFDGFRSDNEFGLLGREDSRNIQDEIKLPFGMEKMVNSLVKQLEKQMGEIDNSGGNFPKGIKIHVSAGRPHQMNPVMQESPRNNQKINEISPKENEKRSHLPRVEVESRMRRLADRIVYEMKTPGVKLKRDVVLAELASGIEVKAYSKDKCYVKFIPLKVEVIGYYLKDEKLFLELKV